MHLPITIGYRSFGVGTHATGAHLVGGEHHDAIDTHAMPLQLAVKLAELLFCDGATFWLIQTCAFIMQGDDGLRSGGEMRAGRLAQAVQDMIAIIDGDHVVYDWLAITIKGNSAFTFVAGQYNK